MNTGYTPAARLLRTLLIIGGSSVSVLVGPTLSGQTVDPSSPAAAAFTFDVLVNVGARWRIRRPLLKEKGRQLLAIQGGAFGQCENPLAIPGGGSQPAETPESVS